MRRTVVRVWVWVVLCVVILVLGGIILYGLARDVVRKGSRLLDEVAAASARMTEASAPADPSVMGATSDVSGPRPGDVP